MKHVKIAVLIVLLVLGAAGTNLIAQETSQLSVLTNDLFRTELDAAFDPVTVKSGPAFGELGGDYFFGGVTNFPDLNENNGAFTDGPLTLGYYSESGTPFSFMAGADVNVSNATNANGLAITGTTTKPVNADTMDWINQTTDTDARLTAYNISLSPYYLTSVGDMNLAIDLSANYVENAGLAAINTWASNNSTVVTTNYYDTTAANIDPIAAVNFTRTVTQTAPDTRFTVNASIPIWMPQDNKSGFLLTPYVGFTNRNQNMTYAETLSNPVNAVANINNVVDQNNVTDSYSVLSGGASFASYAEGMGDHADNRMIISGSAYVMYGLPATYSSITRQQDYTAAGASAAPTVTNIDTWQDVSTTRAGELGASASAGFANSFYFDLGEGVVTGLKPGVVLDFGLGTANATYYHNVATTTTSWTDANADNQIVAADDTQTVTTVTNYNNGDGGTISGDLTFTLPGAVSFRPGNGVFTFYVSATPRAIFSLDVTNDVSSSQITHTVVTTAGTVTSDVTATDATGVSSVSILPGFDFDLATGAGLRFHIAENGSIDVSLNSSVSGTQLSAEAVYSLP